MAARTIGQSVAISVHYVLGPNPQTMRSAFGGVGWAAPLAISLMMMRAVASASLIFTGLTRLP